MRKSLIVIMLAGGIGFSALASPASAGTSPGKFSLKATKRLRGGVTTNINPPTSQVMGAMVGDEYTVEFRISEYGDFDVVVDNIDLGTINELGGVQGYQGVVDCLTSAPSGGNPAGLILPKGWDAPLASPSCTSDGDCDFAPGLHCDLNPLNPQICVGAAHNPAQGIALNVSNPNWIHAGFDTSSGVRFASLDGMQMYSSVSGQGALDPGSGHEFYGGQMVFVVRPFACGTFEINFREGTANVIRIASGSFDFFPALEGLTIEVTPCGPVKMASDPADCFIDPKRPHAPASMTPREGIGSVLLTFDLPTGSMVAGDFSIAQIGGGTNPGFQVQSLPSNQLRVSFLRQLQPAVLEVERWTCLTHDDTNLQNCWGVLPGDVNQDQVVDEDDFTSLTTILRASTVDASNVPRCDLDRSGRCTPLDVLAEADMQGGGETYPRYEGHALSSLPACPPPAP